MIMPSPVIKTVKTPQIFHPQDIQKVIRAILSRQKTSNDMIWDVQRRSISYRYR
jgi:hypothetical protein